jgi:hypothetical protein
MTVAISVYHERSTPPARVTTVAELDDLLDHIHRDPGRREAPPLVELVMDGTDRALDIGLGRTEHSVLIWHDDDADEVLTSTSTGELDPGPDAAFNFGGTWTHIADGSAIPVELARHAAREFAETGRRPTCIEWQIPAYAS